ncbi:MAG: tyrosine-type recombinase/integrase [Candidatus Nomurabacteria bacterium]
MKKSAPTISVSAYLSQFINASSSGRRLTPSGKRITSGTILNYQYVQKLLLQFEQRVGHSLRIQLLHRASMATLQKERKYWARFYTQFASFLYKEKGYHDHYVKSTFKVLKSFFNYLQNDKGFSVGNYHKLFRTPLQNTAPVVLLPERLQFLISDKAFEEGLNTHLERAKDIFVFGCTVALRVSDLMNLQKRNIVNTGDEIYLSICTKKTGTEIKIPLPAYAIDIIKKYKRVAGKYILPRLSVTNLNIQIKKLIESAGWNYPLPKIISRQGKLIELKLADGKPWRFHQHITAHTMRRTAITTLLIMGVPELMVRKLSGHAPASKEFYKYVNIAQEYLNKEVLKAFNRLAETDFTLKTV